MIFGLMLLIPCNMFRVYISVLNFTEVTCGFTCKLVSGTPSPFLCTEELQFDTHACYSRAGHPAFQIYSTPLRLILAAMQQAPSLTMLQSEREGKSKFVHGLKSRWPLQKRAFEPALTF